MDQPAKPVYRNLFNELVHTANPNIQISTDASKTQTDIGLVVVHQNTTQLFQLNTNSSIYMAEYVALLKEVQTALKIDNTRINICSDSLSTLSNLKNSVQ